MTNPSAGDAYSRHADLFRQVRDFTRTLPEASGYLRGKYEKLADPVKGRHLLGLLEYELARAGVSLGGARVLDAGCGTGIYSVMFAALGGRVVGLDAFAENIGVLGSIASRFGLPIEPVLRDVADSGLEAGSVDFVYCIEAISHFHDWDGFLVECGRVLRGGGSLVIGDGNNGANPAVRGAIHDDWTASEIGPFTVNAFGSGENLPYLYRRWMIIRREFPSLSDDQVFQLGLRTSGVGGGALLEACRRFQQSGTLPDSPYARGLSQSRPEDGQHNEEPLDPRVLAGRLKQLGFRARVRPHFGYARSPLLPLLNDLGEALSPLAIRFANRYLVIATRR